MLVLKEKAEILATNGVVFRSERLELPAPAVVRLRYFVRIPYRAHAALTRRAVFARDGWVCQYCGLAAENVDHVIPRSSLLDPRFRHPLDAGGGRAVLARVPAAAPPGDSGMGALPLLSPSFEPRPRQW